MADLVQEEKSVSKIAPLAPVDYVLERFGLPRVDPLLRAISPQNIISNVIGAPTPNDLGEALLERVDADIKAKRPLGLRGLPFGR